MNAIAILTFVHVLLSLVGLVAGFVVLWGLLSRHQLNRWTALFLTATIATSASGFLFPVDHVTPGHVLGVISLVVLSVAVVARYQRRLAGWWRGMYAVSAVTAQYLNFFVLIVQLFLKVPMLQALAPTQSEPVFVSTQLVTLGVFVGLAVAAALRFRKEAVFSHLPYASADNVITATAGK